MKMMMLAIMATWHRQVRDVSEMSSGKWRLPGSMEATHGPADKDNTKMFLPQKI